MSIRQRLRAACVCALLALTALAVPVHADGLSTTIVLRIDQSTAAVNSADVALDTAPTIVAAEGRTYVPVRFIAENLGVYVGWDGNQQKITFLTGDTRIELFIGQRTAKVNGKGVTLDASPFINADNRTLVPVRFISEQLGASVAWDGDARAVTVTAPWAGKVVLLKDTRFDASTLTVDAGTRVTWVNTDQLLHDVTGPGFSSGLLSPGDAFAYTFASAGTYHVECSLHPGMESQVVVR